LSKSSKTKVIQTSGKRKRAIARLKLSEGKGQVRINGVALDAFGTELARLKVREPLLLVPDIAGKIHISITVNGGGIMSQVDAMRQAIGRALSEFGGAKVKKVLLDYDRTFLVADTRRKEPCKPNVSKARAKRQKSYR